jgi:transcriptional regulator with XRE-family HTH domain
VPASTYRHNLARLRQQLNLNQIVVAQLVNCTVDTIRSIETGRLPLSAKMALKLQYVLGVESGWLLGNDLTSPIPKSAHGPQERQLRDEDTIETKEQLGAVFKILDQLPDKTALMLFKHFTNRYLRDIHNNFARFGPGLPRAEGLDYITASVAAAKRQKAKRLHRSKHSQNRQSA